MNHWQLVFNLLEILREINAVSVVIFSQKVQRTSSGLPQPMHF
jgi:hypothetical protein